MLGAFSHHFNVLSFVSYLLFDWVELQHGNVIFDYVILESSLLNFGYPYPTVHKGKESMPVMVAQQELGISLLESMEEQEMTGRDDILYQSTLNSDLVSIKVSDSHTVLGEIYGRDGASVINLHSILNKVRLHLSDFNIYI